MLNLEDMNNNYYENQQYFGSPMKYQLPSQFFEKICDLENSLLEDKDLIKVENLARLYKIGVEFYSGVNSVKENDFLFRLQALFSSKSLSQLYEENNDSANKHVKINVKKKARFNLEVNTNKENDTQSAASILSKFEIRFNNALNLVRNDIIAQESNMANMIKKKKCGVNLLAEIVSKIILIVINNLILHYNRELLLKQEDHYHLFLIFQEI